MSKLKSYNVEISMDGIGRCKDNIFVERTLQTLKYEWIFLRDYNTQEELRKLLDDFVQFFNKERIHQGLDYKTPDEVHKEGSFSSASSKRGLHKFVIFQASCLDKGLSISLFFCGLFYSLFRVMNLQDKDTPAILSKLDNYMEKNADILISVCKVLKIKKSVFLLNRNVPLKIQIFQ